MVRAIVLAAAVAFAPTFAHADDYFEKSNESSTVKIRQDNHRTTGQRIAIYSLLGAGAIGLGLGLYWHVDSRNAAHEIESVGTQHLGIWNDERMDIYDRGQRSGTLAIVSYSLSAASLAAAMVVTYLTRPGDHLAAMRPAVSPTQGGAIVSREWTW
jgi:hypothetical protein